MKISATFENGILVMLGSSLSFAIFDSLVKYLVGSFSAAEIAFARFGFGALTMLPSLFRETGWRNRRDLPLLILRGLTGTGAFYTFMFALQTTPLSVTVVLFFTSPIWALFMGTYFLDERLTWERTLCVLSAFIGILVLINPSDRGISWGYLFGIISGILGGVNNVITRHLRTRISGQVIYASHCIVGTLFSIPGIAGHVRLPEPRDGMLLLLASFFGLTGQVAMNHGFRFIRAAEGATLLMSEAVLTALVGILLFHEPLSMRFAIGTVMILGSGILLGVRSAGRSSVPSES